MHQRVAAQFGLEGVLDELSSDKQEASNALRTLIRGNQRYYQAAQEGCKIDPDRRMQLVESQSPLAVVVCCSDSRCPPELIFDQGLGELFVIRVAGNVVNQHILGSISYALQHLHTRLIVVLGHTNCGAIKASVADFVDSTTRRIKEREEEAAAQQEPDTAKSRESRSFFSKLFAMLGGREQVAQLVRTASFRDAEHAAHPINSIVLSIAPAVKDVVWALLQAPAEARGQYAPSGAGCTSGSASPATEGGGPASRRGSIDPGRSASSRSGADSEDGAAAERVGGVSDPAREILGDLKRNSSAWALRALGEEGDDAEECGWALREGPNNLKRNSSTWALRSVASRGTSRGGGGGGQSSGGESECEGETEEVEEGEEGHCDHHLAPLRWDCDSWGAATATEPEVPEDMLHSRLSRPSVNICLHTAMRCSKVVNSVIYQNVRRQGGEIWEGMRAWVEGEEMRHVLMATAVYDLATGRADFFGLQSC